LNLIDNIGNTPLFDLSSLFNCRGKFSLFAKAEYLNPGGSLKDRPVKRMICNALNNGSLKNGNIILDSSSGNAGIAYSMVGASLGIRVKIVIPGNASLERLNRLKAHGAELELTDPLEGYDEAIKTAKRLAENYPDKYFYCNQYANDDNWLAHYEETAEELLSQVPQKITHFVCGIGTGGTITGIGRKLKEKKKDIKIICVKPVFWPGIEGLKPLEGENDIKPEILDESVIDHWIDVTCDEAKKWCGILAKSGIFAGQSTGAYLAGCNQVIKQEGSGVYATLINDLGERYLSTGLWKS